jgi:Family of unknown function (DUF6065)
MVSTNTSDSSALLPVPELFCYAVGSSPPEIVPARADREWMDKTHQRFAYRCTPLSIANSSGWELLLPFSIEATWVGGSDPSDIILRSDDPRCKGQVTSHFGHGVLTFHPQWLFRTSPGWAIWARGTPNTSKRNIVPLDGLIETDWLPFTFTMNWRFTSPGTTRFEKGEAFCFISLTPHGILDSVQPRIVQLEENPLLRSAYDEWRSSREDFNGRLRQLDAVATAEGWQRKYVRGAGGAQGDQIFHISKRRLKSPK